MESSFNQVEQHGRRNNIIISGISDDISDNDLESNVIDIMKDVDVDINSNDLEACNRIGKSDWRIASKKTIVHFTNRKYCKKALLKRKLFATINTITNYNFSHNNQVFTNESLTKTNDSLAFCGRKLKRSGLIHSCYTKGGFVHIKKSKHSKAIKVHHINSLYEQFPEFVFFDDDDDDDDCDLFVVASPNISGQFSY